MLKNTEEITKTKKRITFEIPAEAFEAEFQKAVTEIRAKTRLPGFRPGKAPLAMIEKRFSKEIEGEVMEKVIPRFYSEALTEAGITPVTEPVIEGGMDFKRNSPMTITFTVEFRPEVGDISFEGITVRRLSADVDEKDIDETLVRIRDERAQFEPSDAPARDNDLVLIDYDEREGGDSHKDEAFRVGAETMPLGFYEKIKGLKKGDKATVEVTYPADHHTKELAGQTRRVDVTVKEVKSPVMPELDDEFAKDLGLDSLEALRQKVRERLGEARERTSRRVMKAEAMKKLLDLHTFEVPETLVQREMESLIDNARMSGRKDDPIEALRADFSGPAERNVRASMLLQIIGEREKVEVTEPELRERVMAIASEMRLSPENVMKYYISRDGNLDGLRHGVLEDKVLDLVIEKVQQVEMQEETTA